MYEKYPITGIKQSYRHTRDTPTVVMPVLIVTLLVGMAVFFVKSKPQETPAPQDMVSLEEENQLPVARPAIVAEPVDPTASENDVQNDTEPESPTTEESETGRTTASVSSDGFTPWMTPLALDTYIRHRNRGFEESFWQRGHWITAVEGRWENGTREFRLSLGTVPDSDSWQWQYRVNHTAEEFVSASKQFSSQGFKLVQSQSFREPSGTTRYQGVWQRETDPVAPTMELSTAAAIPSTELLSGNTPLDVNNLRFR